MFDMIAKGFNLIDHMTFLQSRLLQNLLLII